MVATHPVVFFEGKDVIRIILGSLDDELAGVAADHKTNGRQQDCQDETTLLEGPRQGDER